jgi:hypothetical protein
LCDKLLLLQCNLFVVSRRRKRLKSVRAMECFARRAQTFADSVRSGFSSYDPAVSLPVPLSAAARSRTDVGLLNPPAIHVHLGKNSTVAIMSKSSQLHVA